MEIEEEMKVTDTKENRKKALFKKINNGEINGSSLARNPIWGFLERKKIHFFDIRKKAL